MYQAIIQTIIQTVVTVLCSVLASAGFWSYMQKIAEKKDAKTDMLVGLGHDRIVYLGMEYIERGNITKDEYENLKCQFGTSNGSGTENGYGGRRTLPYSALGGNGSAKKVMEEVNKLPIHESLH